MRVWIPSERRYGEDDEVRWCAEIARDPKPEGDPDYAIDRLEYEFDTFKSRSAAIRGAKKMKSNVWDYAHVYEERLEQISGNIFEWRRVGDIEEVICILELRAEKP